MASGANETGQQVGDKQRPEELCVEMRECREYCERVIFWCHCFTALSQSYESDDYKFPISANFLIASPVIPWRWPGSRSNNYKDVGCNSISKSPNDY